MSLWVSAQLGDDNGSVLGLEMTMQYSYQFVGSLTIVIVSRIEMHAGI